AVVEALDGFAVAEIVAPVRARHAGQLFLLSNLGVFQHEPNARRADGDGLLHENMLARFHSSAEVDGAERRWLCQDHDVHTTVDDALVVVKARKASVRRDIAALFQLFLEAIERTLQAIGEQVTEGVNFYGGVGVGAINGGARPAPATADDTDTQFARTLRVDEGDGHARHSRRQRHFEEVTARRLFLSANLLALVRHASSPRSDGFKG
ncbi:MAG: hypothetical protein PVTTEEND_001660, partial [Candidatus Fervidibacter sp.]